MTREARTRRAEARAHKLGVRRQSNTCCVLYDSSTLRHPIECLRGDARSALAYTPHTQLQLRASHGCKRRHDQPLAVRVKRKRSCKRSFLFCQNSMLSGTRRKPPQCGGRGIDASTAKRSTTSASFASSAARSAIG
jgi:hypothetical protein